MAKIKIEGLGIIEIEGDVPTNQEIKAIGINVIQEFSKKK